MKTVVLCFAVFFCFAAIQAQSVVYDDFESSKYLIYDLKGGGPDTASKNPAPDKINGSVKCAKYIRSSDKAFDNVKMGVKRRLVDVSPFATYTGNPPQLKMKVWTNAPAGTLVEILLGSRGRNNEYPAGTNSQYQAYTTKSGAWEELKFKFSQLPQGSLTSTTEVDQITILFNPNSSTSHTYYFDDLSGPSLIPETTATPGNAENK